MGWLDFCQTDTSWGPTGREDIHRENPILQESDRLVVKELEEGNVHFGSQLRRDTVPRGWEDTASGREGIVTEAGG